MSLPEVRTVHPPPPLLLNKDVLLISRVVLEVPHERQGHAVGSEVVPDERAVVVGENVDVVPPGNVECQMYL